MRRWLLGGLALTLLCCGAVVAAVTAVFGASAVSTVDKVDFSRPLAIPPLAPSHLDERGRRVFDLRAQAGTTDFGRGSTRTWGFNSEQAGSLDASRPRPAPLGTYLGPTLRATRGEQLIVNVHNGLPEATTVHWHGMHLPAKMDGGPHQMVRPGATWSPTWRVNQPAATLWYHPHPHGETERHVYRGLAGMFILDDPGTDVAELPRRYGVDDVPVIVQDKSFDGSQFDAGHRFGSDIGVLGDTLLVNGTVGPYHEVSTERVRLRLLNASTARVYNFGFSDDRPFALVGTDGGLLARPYQMESVQLSPGERAEIVVTMRPGEKTVLRSYPPDLRKNALDKRFAGGSDEFDVLQLRAASSSLALSPPVPATLVATPRLNPRDAAQRREFTFSGREINGHKMEMDRVDAVVIKDTTEVWTVRNGHGTPHSFHIHDVQFQVLDVDGEPPPPMLTGWKDTIFLRPHTEFRVIARFADYADTTTPYMFHCHVLFHEDGGMMSQFVVVERGQHPVLDEHVHD